MQIRTVNFKTLSKHFIEYQEGISEISKIKNQYLEKLDPLKKIMQEIIALSQNGNEIPSEKQDEFKITQEEAISIDNEFKNKIASMNDELSKRVYTSLNIIINEWSIINEIDLVISDSEVVYSKSLDATNDIIECIKEKGLFI